MAARGGEGRGQSPLLVALAQEGGKVSFKRKFLGPDVIFNTLLSKSCFKQEHSGGCVHADKTSAGRLLGEAGCPCSLEVALWGDRSHSGEFRGSGG